MHPLAGRPYSAHLRPRPRDDHEAHMAFKVNYGFQKAERDRAKKAKKEAKQREREAAAAPAQPGETPPDAEAPDSDAEHSKAGS
jgi:hypothetical protein